jgi:hypothetical protein
MLDFFSKHVVALQQSRGVLCMKTIMTYISCSALCSMLCGMEPSNQQQSAPASKAQQPPPPYRLEQAQRQSTEHEIFMKEIQAIFMQQSQEIQRRLDGWSKVDPSFDMNPILFNNKRMLRVESSGMSPEKKND